MNDPYAPLGTYNPEIFVEDNNPTKDDLVPFSESMLQDEVDYFYNDIHAIIYSQCKVKPRFIKHAIFGLIDNNGGIIGGEVRIDYVEAETRKKYVRPMAYNKNMGLILGAFGGKLPLFNANKIISNPDAIVVVLEGPKKATTLEQFLGNQTDYVVCSVIGGASSAKRFDWSPLHGRKVVILPDNDPHGMRFAQDVADGCKAKTVRIVDYERVPWIEIMNNKDDVEDIIDRGATSKQVIDLIANRKYEMDHGLYLKNDYKIINNEIKKVDEEEGNETTISTVFQFLGQAKDESSSSWSKHIRIYDYDSEIHDILIPDKDIHTDPNAVIEKLVKNGMHILEHKELIYVLKTLQSKNRSIIVSNPGWTKDDFIAPGHRFTIKNRHRCVFDGYKIEVKKSGMLAEWQSHIARFAIGNPTLMLGLGIGFGAPLLKLLMHDSFMFHLRGQSSSGKTISALFASSISGLELQSWRTTDNALEGICKAHNDMALCLDELKQIDPQQCGPAAYMISNGKGKGRMTSESENKEVKQWRLIGFSTGEISLAEHVMGKTYAGQEVRFIDLQVSGKYGAFDDLHGHADGKSFADAIKQAALKYRGTAIKPYISYLLQSDRTAEMRQIYQSFMGKITGDPQALRVAGNFAILAIGIEMAIKAKILPFQTGVGISSIMSLYEGWKGHHANSGEYRRALASIRDLISTKTACFIIKSDSSKYVPNPLLGFRYTIKENVSFFAISASVWSTMLTSEVKNKSVRLQMEKDGVLLSVDSAQHRCPATGGNGRYYEVNADALDAVLHRCQPVTRKSLI